MLTEVNLFILSNYGFKFLHADSQGTYNLEENRARGLRFDELKLAVSDGKCLIWPAQFLSALCFQPFEGSRNKCQTKVVHVSH